MLTERERKLLSLITDTSRNSWDTWRRRVDAIAELAPLATHYPEVRDAILWRVNADTHAQVRRVAIEALIPLAASCTKVQSALLRQLYDDEIMDISVVAAAKALYSATGKAEVRAAIADRLLLDCKVEYQRCIPLHIAGIRVLAPWVRHDTVAREAMLTEVKSPITQVSLAAAEAIAPLIQDNPQVLEALLSASDTTNINKARGIAKLVLGVMTRSPSWESDTSVRAFLLQQARSGQFAFMHQSIRLLAPFAATDVELREVLLAHTRSETALSEIRIVALHALSSSIQLDDRVKDALLQYITGTDYGSQEYSTEEVRLAAIDAVAAAAEVPTEIEQALLAQITDNRQPKAIRRAALETLTHVGAHRNPSIRKALIHLVKRNDPILQYAIQEVYAAIADIATQDTRFRARLRRYLTHRNSTRRRVAADILQFHADKDAAVRHAMCKQLERETDTLVRRSLIRHLAPYVSNDDMAYDAIMGVLQKGNAVKNHDRIEAIKALSPKLPSDADVLDTLLELMENAPYNEAHSVREAAAEHLAPFIPRVPKVKQAFIEQLHNPQNVDWALDALAAYAPEDHEIQETLIRFFSY